MPKAHPEVTTALDPLLLLQIATMESHHVLRARLSLYILKIVPFWIAVQLQEYVANYLDSGC